MPESESEITGFGSYVGRGGRAGTLVVRLGTRGSYTGHFDFSIVFISFLFVLLSTIGVFFLYFCNDVLDLLWLEGSTIF